MISITLVCKKKKKIIVVCERVIVDIKFFFVVINLPS